jgi:hypothetical protein
VLAAIQFDNEPGFAVREIGNIGTDWKLPDKMIATEAIGFQFNPEQSFRFRAIFSQDTSKGRRSWLSS